MEERTLNPATSQPRAFGRGSPVLDYWLGRCEGFVLVSSRGTQVGSVEHVEVDDIGRALELVVQSPILGRRRTIDPRSIDAVVPESETITFSEQTAPAAHRRELTFRTPPVAGSGRALGASAAWIAPRTRALVAGSARVALAGGAKTLSLVRSGGRWVSLHVRRRVPILAQATRRAVVAAAHWTRPRALALVRLVAALLLGLGLVLVAVGREVVAALKTYRAVFAQEAARRRAAQRRA